MSLNSPNRVGWARARFGLAKDVVATFALGLIARALLSEPVVHVARSSVSDWRSHHILHPAPRKSLSVARPLAKPIITNDSYPGRQQDWLPRTVRGRGEANKGADRDWNVSIGTATFEPIFDYNFNIPPQQGYGSLNSMDLGNLTFLATAGSLTVTAGADQGSYTLVPGGPGETLSPAGGFYYDNVLYYQTDYPLDELGLLFTGLGVEISIWSYFPGNYSFWDYIAGAYPTEVTSSGTFLLNADPGGGQTYPSKFVFDVTAPPSCQNDFVVLGIPANTTAGRQANIVGYNYLYSASTGSPFCGTAEPNVMFAYASGSGQVPNFVTISQSGTHLAYVENLLTGSSYFHDLTIGTMGNNGTDPTAAVAPSAGNNAVDNSLLLSPDDGVTNQSSTNAPFIVYTGGDANDFAYVTTYSSAGGGSGYLYKIVNVFNPSPMVTPSIAWSLPINAIPSTPIFDDVTGQIFFTDSNGSIDYVYDNGVTPPASVVYGPVFAAGTTSENPLTLDYTNQVLYACFNSNGTNALVVQAPVSLASSVSVPVGSAGTIYTGPYNVAFNNAWYTGSGTPLLYVAGTGTGTLPTLYGIGFNMDGTLNSGDVSSAPLAIGSADSSTVTEFYNAAQGVDYLFVGVTNNCIATGMGTTGCVFSLDITGGFPTMISGSTALAASGGVTGIIVDNDSGDSQASSIYFATKTGNSLVKATQSGLQ